MSLGSVAGKVLKNVRAGEQNLLSYETGVAGADPIIRVTSTAFADGGIIPDKYTKKGGDIFPPLAWSNVPEGTHEIVIVAEDEDAPTSDHPFTHLILHGIDPRTTSLAEGSVVEQTKEVTPQTAAPCKVGRNTFGKNAWMGPDPIPGHGAHHYHFQVFALRVPLGLSGEVTRGKLKDALANKVIALGELMGTYEKP